ncbi:MAG: bifunctional UDP-N-acetylglucosamine pyrophosphorylase/glucosamine-1-phosphate N-acetyltransferase [Polaribacter sp.]|jgi:bifunctional UDP-N-acetylglucosamine pyrophosphorylase/glucosamine-1-phosphate N-acetyltransferase
MALSIIILAAGQGTRMKSKRPKVLHHLAGETMLQHVVDTSKSLDPDQIIVVVGYEAERVKEVMFGQALTFVHQKDLLGTGHAVAQCLPVLKSGNDVLVLTADVPLVTENTIRSLLLDSTESDVHVLSFMPANSFGYGRIVRNSGHTVCAIVEQKDANEAEQTIIESNSGIIFIGGNQVKQLIYLLDNDNNQAEYYLTDVVRIASLEGLRVNATTCDDADEVNGVNNQLQLSEAERHYRHRQSDALMMLGVKLYDPARIDLRGKLKVGKDVVIDINCVFEGDVSLGDNVHIGAGCIIKNTTIESNTTILPMSMIDESNIGRNATIGPFSRLRPGTECSDKVKIGNFVETKKTVIGEGSKINHLSYVGDATIGENVNIGAGTITCNYDGVNKSQTIIEDDVFIGSGTQLIAPVTIGRGATIGAGSTITRNTPEQQLTLSRSKQMSISGWQKPTETDKG